MRTTCRVLRDLLTSTIFRNVKLTLFPTPPLDSISSLECACFLPFIRQFHLQFYRRKWKAAKTPGLRSIWRSLRIALPQSTHLEEFVIEMDSRQDHVPMWLQTFFAQSTSIRRIHLIESINAFPVEFWDMVSNGHYANTWSISISRDMDANRNRNRIPPSAAHRITNVDLCWFWNNDALEILINCLPPHLTALTLNSYFCCSTTIRLLMTLLVQCPTIIALDLRPILPLEDLSPAALPRLRKLTTARLTWAGLLIRGRPVEELNCVGFPEIAPSPLEERLDSLLECGSVPLRTLSITLHSSEMLTSPPDLSSLSAISNLTFRVRRWRKQDSVCPEKIKKTMRSLTRQLPQLLIALNAPIRLPVNLKTLVLHVENSFVALNHIPPPSKAVIRQALFNMIARYENTTQTLRLIAVQWQILDSGPRLRYVCSRVGEEWIVDENEMHFGSYSMCLRAGQLIQERWLAGDFVWWWD